MISKKLIAEMKVEIESREDKQSVMRNGRCVGKGGKGEWD